MRTLLILIDEIAETGLNTDHHRIRSSRQRDPDYRRRRLSSRELEPQNLTQFPPLNLPSPERDQNVPLPSSPRPPSSSNSTLRPRRGLRGWFPTGAPSPPRTPVLPPPQLPSTRTTKTMSHDPPHLGPRPPTPTAETSGYFTFPRLEEESYDKGDRRDDATVVSAKPDTYDSEVRVGLSIRGVTALGRIPR